MSPRAPFAAVALLLVLVASRAEADTNYFGTGEEQLTYVEPGSRSDNERIVLYSLFGAAALAGGIGTYFALDSRDLSDEVSASGTHTGKVWSAELEQKRKDALSSRHVALWSYGIAGGFAVAGIVAFIATDPDEVGYKDYKSTSFVAPLQGGLMAGTGWSF
jgi:hypothetical protein